MIYKFFDSSDARHAIVRQSLYKTLVAEMNKFEKNMVLEKEVTIQEARESAALNYQSQMSGLGLNIQSSDDEIVKYWEKVLKYP